jgi:hypothetical protein
LARSRVIIVASALGYFYFTGLRSFAILYVTGHYGLSKPVGDALLVTLGAGGVAGVFVGGRAADRLLRRGHVNARIIVPAVCLLALVPVLAPAIATSSVAIAMPLFLLGAFLLAAPNAAMDAARLDIIHPRLWGRAEGVRTMLRTLGEASAPLVFGYISQYVFGGPGASAASAGPAGTGHPGAATGLEYTFLVFLLSVCAAGLLALLALRTYPRDVATAAASRRGVGRAEKRREQPGTSRRRSPPGYRATTLQGSPYPRPGHEDVGGGGRWGRAPPPRQEPIRNGPAVPIRICPAGPRRTRRASAGSREPPGRCAPDP